MKKILKSVFTIALVAAVAVGASQAFFSDTETSSGNILDAGAIDLKIDNSSWYNGAWQETMSWGWADLDGHLFFNYQDLKPGDWGEDTISIRVDDNDAYVCADVTLTSNEENSITEPEEDMGDDDSTGELAGELNFVWWADDGDNVYENHEQVITEANLGDAWLNQTHTVTLADSQTNVWLARGPIEGETTYHIGKFWCFGDITPVPVNDGDSPGVDPGFLCNGEPVSNVSQSDSATMDVGFYALQARHNEGFTCADDNRTFLRLENKTANWDPILGDGKYGELVFKSSNPTFSFHLDVYGMNATHNYLLLYYADPWPSTNGIGIYAFTTDGSGNWSGDGNVELNADLPVNADNNYPTGAKLWIIPASQWNGSQMTGWTPTEYLHEWNWVTYDVTDIP